MSGTAVKRERDGGHHAIKGFAYQFDASLLRAFDNPYSTVELEGKQDLSLENYHIQVKHRTDRFSISAIAPAVQLMFRQFISDNGCQFLLHCHFADQEPGLERELTAQELERILAGFPEEFDKSISAKFLSVCRIGFRSNYIDQFNEVLARISQHFHTRDVDEACYFHAILHGHVRDIILSNPIGGRNISLRSLRAAVSAARTAIFESAYVEQRGYDRYLKSVRKRYTLREVNITAERLFSFECDQMTDPESLAEVAVMLQNKYSSFRAGGKAPYLTFRGTPDELGIKRTLWEAGARFNDGTGYHGGVFRMDELIDPPVRDLKLKIVSGVHLPELLDKVRFKEFHDFYLNDPLRTPHNAVRASHVFLRSFEDLSHVL
ncbi:hypothetical protein ABZ351_07630 [Streptomyces microflavus]|uniref:hypothetical protein n=1 Tax=Streptomyces microflavus TaxID=1919 RepID=UPI00340208EA